MEGLVDLLKSAKLRKTGKIQRWLPQEENDVDGISSSASSSNPEDDCHPPKAINFDRYKPNNTQERNGMDMLHVAIWKKASVDIIRRIVESDPEMLKTIDGGGLTPLHRTLYVEDFFFNERIFFFLLESYPTASEIPSNNGEFPLHTACRGIYQTVYESNTSNIQQTFGENSNRKPFRNKNAHIVQALINKFPDALEKKNINLQTPLHVAMEDRAPPEIVEVLINEPTKQVRMQDKHGQTPLMAGIKGDAPIKSLEMVLRAYPEAAGVYDWGSDEWQQEPPRETKTGESLDRYGCIPLHVAIRNCLPTDFLLKLLNANLDGPKIRDLQGQLPLHLSLLYDCEPSFISELIRVFPGAVSSGDAIGRPILHMALENIQIGFETISLIVGHDPQVVYGRKSSKYVLPLHVALAHGVDSKIVELLLQEFQDAAKVEDYYDTNEMPLHIGLHALEACCKENASGDTHQRAVNILNSIAMVLKAYPQAAGANPWARDSDMQTALFRYCRILRDMEEKPTQQYIDLMGEIYDAYPNAVEMTCSGGASPVTSLVEECVLVRSLEVANERYCVEKLRYVIRGLRDGRALRPLCGVSGWRSHKDNLRVTHPHLEIFFRLFDESEDGDDIKKTPNHKPKLDLNKPVIPGWTLLEILADFDTVESSDVLLQIVLSQKKKLKKATSEINVTLESDGFRIATSFVSIRAVQETVLTKVADRAKLSKTSPEMKRWGQEYGRFLRRYRIDAAPKHVSETCLVVFATEPREDVDNGRQYEAPVALKFMHSETAFHREIEKRRTTDENYVIPILALYSEKAGIEICCDHIQECHLEVNGIHEELSDHLEIETKHRREFTFMLVMGRGAGVDLHDVINHRNIAGRDVASVLSIALEIAKILRFLNETCHVIHGDVKARNFVAVGSGVMGFRAVDLDNAASISEGEKAGQKRTSSGYLPPEMAAVEVYRRSGSAQPAANTNAIEDLKAKVQAALVANDFVQVANLTKELSRISSVQQTVAPADIIASSKYDMWCFGVLLYYICTGIQLFNVDVREELVSDEDLLRLMEWSHDVKTSKLEKIRGTFLNIRPLTESLLEKDPSKRPSSWKIVIDRLDNVAWSDGSPNKKEATTTGHVFVSYSRRDTEKMLEVYSHLVDDGIPVWMDKELTPGTSNWSFAIERALLDAAVVVVICSPTAKKSEWVSKELLLANDQKLPILPILVDGGDAVQSIPFAIYDVQHIDARENVNEKLPMILKSVKDLLHK